MLSVLAQVDAFRDLPPEGLAMLVALGQSRSFPTGSVLMRQGDASESLYVVVNGRLKVEREVAGDKAPLLLAELGPGEVVGEMGVLDREPRSATVTATRPTETVELSAAAIGTTILRYPEVSTGLLRTISRRLRSSDELAEQIVRRVGSSVGREPEQDAAAGTQS